MNFNGEISFHVSSESSTLNYNAKLQPNLKAHGIFGRNSTQRALQLGRELQLRPRQNRIRTPYFTCFARVMQRRKLLSQKMKADSNKQQKQSWPMNEIDYNMLVVNRTLEIFEQNVQLAWNFQQQIVSVSFPPLAVFVMLKKMKIIEGSTFSFLKMEVPPSPRADVLRGSFKRGNS